MELLERLNTAVEYIEEHLDKEIDYNRAAQIACCSTFHFQRIFSYIAGTPLSEYIRRRRMTAAAFEIQRSDIKIIDIALKYGYESPTSFNRAFQGVHGISPSSARAEGAVLKAYPRISFKISIKGDAEMNYKIETKEALRIVGVKEHLDMKAEDCFKRVPEFWAETTKSGKIDQLCPLIDKPPYGVLGVSIGNYEGQVFDYYIAVSTDKPLPQGMAEYEVPAGTWAIFECVGAMPNAMQELQKRIACEWLPTSGYEYANAPDIEVYPEGDLQSDSYRCEVWFPVIKNRS